MSATVRFGPYELARRLGSGGMAETFLAVRRGPAGFEQHVCVKRILPAFEADPQFVEQFMEEARLAAQLRHANITQVVDFGAVEGSHYLALELVDGMDLRTLLKRQRDRGGSQTVTSSTRASPQPSGHAPKSGSAASRRASGPASVPASGLPASSMIAASQPTSSSENRNARAVTGRVCGTSRAAPSHRRGSLGSGR